MAIVHVNYFSQSLIKEVGFYALLPDRQDKAGPYPVFCTFTSVRKPRPQAYVPPFAPTTSSQARTAAMATASPKGAIFPR